MSSDSGPGRATPLVGQAALKHLAATMRTAQPTPPRHSPIPAPAPAPMPATAAILQPNPAKPSPTLLAARSGGDAYWEGSEFEPDLEEEFWQDYPPVRVMGRYRMWAVAATCTLIAAVVVWATLDTGTSAPAPPPPGQAATSASGVASPPLEVLPPPPEPAQRISSKPPSAGSSKRPTPKATRRPDKPPGTVRRPVSTSAPRPTANRTHTRPPQTGPTEPPPPPVSSSAPQTGPTEPPPPPGQ
ncbi:hypothetical protein GCM10022226_78580 [Sphaerisporangium flaviroseum]|uniref:Uncharacterized protein n=2 Tax=Sphaerisporangium flaviroseum TaxID=509199 RepID=A0ABP7JFG7_9ACTN